MGPSVQTVQKKSFLPKKSPVGKKGITKDDLDNAIQKFLKNGGIIQKLPAQKNSGISRIGEKYNNSQVHQEGGL